MLHFHNQFANLGPDFGQKQSPTPVKAPKLIRINEDLASHLQLNPDQLRSEECIEVFAGNRLALSSQPFAQAYAGHQFGGWNPQLGDGRALLLGELQACDHQFYDIQLKGAGPTAYSRMGDGRSPLGPVLREYLLSEAMNALGIPTTRSLAAVSTGERVVRDTLLPGAVLTRVASSHVRVGTFQFFAARQQSDALNTLSHYVIQRHYPDLEHHNSPLLAMLHAIVDRQALLIAQWMSVGFIHGVMNTDNMLVGGETVDYGPCAFMDQFHPGKVFSSIDHHGRYAYHNQPAIAQWNLAWLAQSLTPLLHDNEQVAMQLTQDAIDRFKTQYEHHYETLMAAKLGFEQANATSNELIDQLLALMTQYQLDFTLTFRYLTDTLVDPADHQNWQDLLDSADALQDWSQQWKSALESAHAISDAHRRMAARNPVVIPRNHWVEKAIAAATDNNDFSVFHRLADTWQSPFTYRESDRDLYGAPKPDEVVLRTFCGT